MRWGMADPKNRVAELVSLLIGARMRWTSLVCASSTSIAMSVHQQRPVIHGPWPCKPSAANTRVHC